MLQANTKFQRSFRYKSEDFCPKINDQWEKVTQIQKCKNEVLKHTIYNYIEIFISWDAGTDKGWP